MPVYNDWESADVLCRHLDRELANRDERIEIILVDDGSAALPSSPWPTQPLGSITIRGILELTRNVGHQRAIAIGLAYVHESVPADAVLIMDADGEDRPEDVPRLLDGFTATAGGRVVFARRRKRVEGLVFRAGYMLYRTLHRVLTGTAVQVGNFSIIPAKYVANLVVSSALWAHYAAAVYSSRLPVHLIPADRGRRISGRSHMNYVLLVTHGLAALSVFRHRVGARLMIAVAALCSALSAGLFFAALYSRGPASSFSPAMAAISILLIAQIAITGFGFAFAMFAESQELGCVPIRDYQYFVRGFKRMNEPRTIPVSRR